ncbi:MAG: hypothetical protein JO115_12620 [Pseudonocardiales bacterium]|nr:hypothetical protein [Pseudonocardiales bacterium]
MAELPDQPADNDIVNPWNVREMILNTGCLSAKALKRWQQALDLNYEIVNLQRRRGASAYDIAYTRFNNYTPLVRLDRLNEAEQVLRDCRKVFETVDDMTMLADVYTACADLESRRGHLPEALALQRTALRLHYVRPQPRSIAASHHNLASYLLCVTGMSAEQRAHRLAAALLNHLTSDTHDLAHVLRALGIELQGNTDTPGAPALPTTLPEVIGLVDAGDGVHFGDLVATLCPDPDTANQALADLLATAATLPEEP